MILNKFDLSMVMHNTICPH